MEMKMRRITPNMITSLRFFIFGPLACVFLMQGWLLLALIAMILGEITDILDGVVARRSNRVSSLGKIYDPMCDSLCHMAVWIVFQALGWIPVYLTILFFSRDMVVAYIRICLASHHEELGARLSGKVKAISQAVAQTSIVLLHIVVSGNAHGNIHLWIIWVAALITAWSLCDYSWNFYKVVKKKGLFSAQKV